MRHEKTSPLFDCPIVIVGGSGGVGKTSISAALGIKSAQQGGKTLVLTIDPARRLAGALGLSQLQDEPVEITSKLRCAGLETRGQLFAMMLDVETTMNRVVRACAADPKQQNAILQNPIYSSIAKRLSGSQEFASMQRLQDIVRAKRFDRVILDTPPSTHALDFLSAPQRLADFFDSRVLSVFSKAARRSNRNFKLVRGLLLRALDRLTGEGVIRDMAEFFVVAEPLLKHFEQQAGVVGALLRSDSTKFVVVSGPSRPQLKEALGFQNALSTLHIAAGAVIVNRCLEPLGPEQPREPRSNENSLESRVEHWYHLWELKARDQSDAVTQFEQACEAPVLRIPAFANPVNSIRALHEMAGCL